MTSMTNALSRQNRLRRCVYYLAIFTIILCIIAGVHGYYGKTLLNFYYSEQSTPAYNEYIDQEGKYLPYSGYKILHLIKKPMLVDFNELYYYLYDDYELRLYFNLVPIYAYHLTLTNLKNRTSYDKKYLKILTEEQEFLDTMNTHARCFGKQIYMIEKQEIRLKVEITDSRVTDAIKAHQKRWNEKFPELIIEQCTSFYITLAYQYQAIPTTDIRNEIEERLKRWQLFTMEIELDPIEISSYSNLVTYSAILPDISHNEIN